MFSPPHLYRKRAQARSALRRLPLRGIAHRGARLGFSMVEVQVALVIFGVALSGMAPYMVMYTKQLRVLQERFDPNRVYYLAPATDLWSRKLGVSATVVDEGDGISSGLGTLAPPAKIVKLVSVDKSIATQQITAQLTVEDSP